MYISQYTLWISPSPFAQVYTCICTMFWTCWSHTRTMTFVTTWATYSLGPKLNHFAVKFKVVATIGLHEPCSMLIPCYNVCCILPPSFYAFGWVLDQFGRRIDTHLNFQPKEGAHAIAHISRYTLNWSESFCKSINMCMHCTLNMLDVPWCFWLGDHMGHFAQNWPSSQWSSHHWILQGPMHVIWHVDSTFYCDLHPPSKFGCIWMSIGPFLEVHLHTLQALSFRPK
jgi:hypothetical protein